MRHLISALCILLLVFGNLSVFSSDALARNISKAFNTVSIPTKVARAGQSLKAASGTVSAGRASWRGSASYSSTMSTTNAASRSSAYISARGQGSFATAGNGWNATKPSVTFSNRATSTLRPAAPVRGRVVVRGQATGSKLVATQRNAWQANVNGSKFGNGLNTTGLKPTPLASRQAASNRSATVSAPKNAYYGTVASNKLSGLSFSQTKTSLLSGQQTYKGTTRIGHSLSKHINRRPDVWGSLTGPQATWHAQGMKHYREIMRGSGNFKQVRNSKGLVFFEKRLADGRGIRLEQNFRFKGFID